MAANVAELLAEHGIRPKSQHSGHTERLICPRCNGGTEREKCLSVTIDHDGLGATWHCFRGTCGWRDGGRVHDAEPRQQRSAPIPAITPPPHPEAMKRRPAELYAWFAERGIGEETVDAFGCYLVERSFPDIGRQQAVVFPYTWQGDTRNRKYRPLAAKHPQAQEAGALPTLFNVDAIGEPDEVVWVEGEPDVMACHEAGFPQTVSLRDGAPAANTRNDEKRYAALGTHADLLGQVKRFILATDADAPGLALREELARRLGRHRCSLVDWPDGCKDANDVLRQHGPRALQAALIGARPYPIEGVHQVEHGTLLALRKQLPPATLTTGTRASDLILKLPAEGRLIVVTGFPTMGKTTWTRFLMVHTATNHDRRWLAFSPESQPWEHFASECAQTLVGKPFWPGPTIESMSQAEISHAEEWLRERVAMLVCDAEDEAPTLDWILERARLSVLRLGITDLLIDPWNEVHSDRGNLSETDQIGRCLQRIKAFAFRHGCNAWIVAHPKMPSPLKPGEKRQAPGPYEIAGSAHWANKADVGLTIHSQPDSGLVELHVWKARFRRWARRGVHASIGFDAVTGRYSTPTAALLEEVEQPRVNRSAA